MEFKKVLMRYEIYRLRKKKGHMFYLIVLKINTHYQDERNLGYSAEICGEDGTSRNYALSTHV